MQVRQKPDTEAARQALLKRMLAGEGVDAAAPAPISPRDPAAPVPLTFEQNQLWLHAQMAPEMPLYNESITIHRFGPYHHEALEKALSEVVRRHAIWRSAIREGMHEGPNGPEGTGEFFLIEEPARHLSLPIIDISHLPADRIEAEAVRLAAEDARAPIDIDHAPLFRARVVQLGAENHRLYLTLHHVIFDGVSIYRTLVPELAALVAAFEKGEGSPLVEPRLQYADYSVWQHGRGDDAEYRRQIAFWRDQLAEPLPRLEVAGDRPRPAVPTHAGSMEVFEIDTMLTERLKGVARAENATLYAVLLAGFKAMLYRYTGDEDVIVGGVTDTRRRPELQSLMGYFLNTMAIRSRPSGARPFRDYLAEVKRSVIGALDASEIPFDKLVRDLGIKRGSGTHPLFNTLFSIEPPVDPFPPGWDLTQMDVVVGAAKYDLYLELDERPEGGMAARFLYSTELFDPATIRRMIGHWLRLLEGVAADPGAALDALPMLDAEERASLASDWNQTGRPLAYESVVDWFAASAAAHPDSVAIEQDGETWTYADLSARADTVAAELADRGVGPGALVGLSLERTPWMVAAMLGIARTGAAYLPLDPGFPPARLRLIVESAQPALILAEASTRGVFPDGHDRLVLLDPAWQPRAFAGPAADPGALVYVLYTSGSTGKPKGVEIEHRALANFLLGMQESLGLAPGASILAITTLSFDIAELEIWLPLVTGGKVHLARRETAMDMAALAATIARTQPDVLQATPATWRGLIEAGWAGQVGLVALCGGEALPRTLADQILSRVGVLWNMYGPTETTIWSTLSKIEPGDAAISIGRPIANTVVRVLDNAGNERPVGAIGELLIGGLGLARGYRGRPDLTDERFVTVRGERLYRTGDLARWRPDGTLECLGRTDNELKIRGFRIAIEEVEAALSALPGIAHAAARAWPDPSGELMLAGYLVPNSDNAGEVQDWREKLAETLPDYMIPTRFVQLGEMPMTPNGKVDRKALPEPGAPEAGVYVPPETADETRLAVIWQDVLKVPRVSRFDDFFDLGGHSLLIARLIRRVDAEYGLKLPMGALFRAPRLADMAELISSGKPIEQPALSPIQPHGTQPPILWLDGGSTFLPMAERLGLDQPFLGVSIDAVLDAYGGCPKDFNETVRLTVETLRQIQPEGPYRLGGWCTAGIIAYGVAARLKAQGEQVPLLVMAHSFHPTRARQIGFMRYFASKFAFHVVQSLQQPKGERWRYFRERLQGISDAAALIGGREAVLQPKLRSDLDESATAWTPPDYAGNVVLFQPTDYPGVLDFTGNWRAQIDGRFVCHVVPGGHRTMLEEPNVAVFAALLAEELALADSDSGQRKRV